MNMKREHSYNWWQKFLGLFKRERSATIFEDAGLIGSSSHDPLKVLDSLQALVTELRSTLEGKENDQWDLNVLAASTYLYHIDRMLVKVRENLLTIRYRNEQFKDQSDLLQSPEFIQVKQAEEHCFMAVLNLTAILKRTSIKTIYDDEIVTRIHALELESTHLNMAVRSLNQLTFRSALHA